MRHRDMFRSIKEAWPSGRSSGGRFPRWGQGVPLRSCRPRAFPGDSVVVQTSSGPEIGQVVEPPHTVDEAEIVAALKKVARVATGKDLEAQAASEDLRRQAMDTAAS